MNEVGHFLANMLKPLDPFSQYGELEDGINKMILSSKLCGTIMNGVVYHLERISGNDVVGCDKASP